VLRRRSWLWIALSLLGLGFLATWQLPAWSAARQRRIRWALLEELQPVALENCALRRFGGPNDTGILFCRSLLEGVQAAYSYGIRGNDDAGCDISSRYRVPVHQYDCVDMRRPVCADGYAVFHDECLSERRARIDSRTFDTLANHLSTNGDSGRRVVVKIDVEGAEWDVLMATEDDLLTGIDQLAIEFHGVNERHFLKVVQKLKRTFHVANVYFNNHACSADAAPLPATVYQVLFVNKRVGVLDAAEPGVPLPSPRNAPDNPGAPDCQPEIPDRAARERQLRAALLDELRPVALQNCTLARFGSPNDGGYLMCANLLDGLESAYSYGVGPNDDWGCDVSTKYRVPVHQYDCFDPARPACRKGKFVFHDECIDDRRERVYGKVFDTLTNQISANGDRGKRLVVKIDVEGAEWDALMATPDEVLQSIGQLPMELHGIDDSRFLKVVRKLKRTFYLVNLHFNNFTCSEKTAPLSGWAYQVLFVNKKLGVLDPSKGTPSPSPLNAPDFPELPDCQTLFDVPVPRN
jgi:hypothetical protein